MIGGGFGALSRYAISLLSVKVLGTMFPWGTLFVNLCGCFFIGIFAGLTEKNLLIGPNERLFLITGFLGAMTTFSTYAIESVSLVIERPLTSVVNIVLNNAMGLFFAVLGMYLVRYIK